MKLWMKLLLTGIGSFAGGFALGYFVRKKAFEVQIEEISEEELEKLAGEQANEENNDIQVPEIAIEPIPQDEKEAYFKRWKEEAPVEQYDTRSTDIPDDVTVTDEDLNSIEDYLHGLKDVEAGTMQDWMHWIQVPEGEYDTMELTWYEKDDVLCDDDGEPLMDSERYMGFNVGDEFDLIDPDTTGDENVRVIFNHKTHSLYYITRIPNTAYAQVHRMEELGHDGYDDVEEG